MLKRRKEKMSKLKRRQKGFTLIEVLLIVVILGIIAAIAIPRLMASRAQAQEKTCRTNVANINTALEKYYFDTGKYPGDTGAATFTDFLSLTDYFPDGAPVCPSGGTYSLKTTKRAKCTIHGDIDGSDTGT